MDKRVKYFILAIVFIANLIYQIKYNFSLWNIFKSSLLVIILFYQFANVGQNKVSKFLVYVMIVVCIIEAYTGLKRNDWFKTYASLAFMSLMLRVCLEPTLIMLTRFFLKHEHYSIALKFANSCIFIFKKKSYILALKGNILNLLNRFDEALVCLEESHELGYDDPFVYYNMGYCLMRLEDWEKACHYLKLASDINPNEFAYAYTLSEILIYLGEYDEALYYTSRALESNGKNELLNEQLEKIKYFSD